MKRETRALERKPADENERRTKKRFPIRRELRYKLLDKDEVVAAGAGLTCDMASEGVAFTSSAELPPGAFIELSISWPVLLDERCAMRLIAFGRVVRSANRLTACTIDKYEFRTQAIARTYQLPIRNDTMLQRWAVSCAKEGLKLRAASA